MSEEQYSQLLQQLRESKDESEAFEIIVDLHISQCSEDVVKHLMNLLDDFLIFLVPLTQTNKEDKQMSCFATTQSSQVLTESWWTRFSPTAAMKVQEITTVIIGNMACMSLQNKEIIKSMHGVEVLLNLVKATEDLGILANAAWIASYISSGEKDECIDSICESFLLTGLLKLLFTHHKPVRIIPIMSDDSKETTASSDSAMDLEETDSTSHITSAESQPFGSTTSSSLPLSLSPTSPFSPSPQISNQFALPQSTDSPFTFARDHRYPSTANTSAEKMQSVESTKPVPEPLPAGVLPTDNPFTLSKSHRYPSSSSSPPSTLLSSSSSSQSSSQQPSFEFNSSFFSNAPPSFLQMCIPIIRTIANVLTSRNLLHSNWIIQANPQAEIFNGIAVDALKIPLATGPALFQWIEGVLTANGNDTNGPSLNILTRDCVRLLHHIACHGVSFANAILRHPVILQSLVQLLDKRRYSLFEPAASCLAYIANCSAAHLGAVINLGTFPSFVSLHSSLNPTMRKVSVCMMEIVLRMLPKGKTMMEEANGYEALEVLSNKDPELREQAQYLMNKYFDEDEMDYDEGDGMDASGEEEEHLGSKDVGNSGMFYDK
ncbi:uncharacterized protein MONOS_2811 [Monocercomonoides exilis]|uniref:uncharacterized protein n=1 Tax=Monocercomonoides exilis TaxID=2049356 RepID=UPI0035593A95|nr:hypothetical protein MONOS_2811 [Monocercomonoides exilis]|eukprot:MONOS_2811.1-p1 / transcript=MONOS_2811.1 / gene=MONOS_2811 / organism=Monocercomonoides_exilis_PA203 / gene_product=unspecified product / transcript_product=unspecified product / location=Mono_scaffold00060:95732-98785(-) / protein_length=603 / sequence_SO=supercontig / SO=protein_coding / is_pseudo=false